MQWHSPAHHPSIIQRPISPVSPQPSPSPVTHQPSAPQYPELRLCHYPDMSMAHRPFSYSLITHEPKFVPLWPAYHGLGLFLVTTHRFPLPRLLSMTTSSSSSTTNVHRIQTRSKSGIFKVKHLLSRSVSLLEPEPTSITYASKYSLWRSMAKEYNALLVNRTWDLVHPMLHKISFEVHGSRE